MKAVPYSRHLTFLAIALAGCLTDLATKRYVFHWLGMPRFDEFKVWWIWEPYIGLQTSTNQGALFGIGQGKVWIFAAASVVAVVAICYWLFIAGAGRDWLLTIALALVMGGVLGNLHDRLGLWPVPDMPEAPSTPSATGSFSNGPPGNGRTSISRTVCWSPVARFSSCMPWSRRRMIDKSKRPRSVPAPNVGGGKTPESRSPLPNRD